MPEPTWDFSCSNCVFGFMVFHCKNQKTKKPNPQDKSTISGPIWDSPCRIGFLVWFCGFCLAFGHIAFGLFEDSGVRKNLALKAQGSYACGFQ